jgi:hypothetical protein
MHIVNRIKMHVETITINVLNHKFLIQAKTGCQLEDWFKSELPVHLWKLKRLQKTISGTNTVQKCSNSCLPMYTPCL